MNVKAWKKHTPRLAQLEVCLKIRIGMIGCSAKRISTNTKRTAATSPKVSKQITTAEFHENDVPPNCSPNRKRNVLETMKRAPSQSVAVSPLNNGVRGVLRSRNNIMMMKAIPSRGRLM